MWPFTTRKELELQKKLAFYEGQLSLRTSTLQNPDDYLLKALRDIGMLGPQNESGVIVDERSAVGIAAFADGLNLIGNGMASMRLKHYRRLDNGDKREIDDELIDRPNPWQTQFAWVKYMSTMQAARGNAFSRIVRDKNFKVTMTIPIHPRYVQAVVYEEDLFYRIELQGHPKVVHHTDMIHWKGLCVDNFVWGISPIEWHAQQLGTILAAEKSAGRFYKAGAKKFLLYGESGKTLDDPAKASLKSDIESVLNNTSNTMVIPNGIKLDYLTVSPQEAEYLNTLKNGAVEVARMLSIPAFMLDAGEGGNKSSAEQDSINFYQMTLHPKTTDLQQEMKYKLLSNPRDYYKFNFDSMLRADAKTRAEVERIRQLMGWSNNDIRLIEDWPMYEGGDRRRVSLQEIPQDREDEYLTGKIQGMKKEPNPSGDNNNTQS